MLVEYVIVFLIASLILVKSASYSVKSISKIALDLKFSGFFAAFVIAGFISIMPELFIGINSSLVGIPSVGLATILGSNIADMTLLVAIIALVGRKIIVDKKTISNSLYFVIITSLPILLMLDGQLTRDDGLILILAFVYYIYTVIKKEKLMLKGKKRKKGIGKNFAIFIASMSILFISAHFMVESGIGISNELHISPVIVGLLVIALGTTLPELTFSLRAVISKHKEIALGDLLGNVAIDSTFTIGIIAIINPITNNFSLIITSAMFMILAALVVSTLINAGKKITWQESFLLLFIYAMFIAIEFIMKGTISVI